jgi:hypothetical protein
MLRRFWPRETGVSVVSYSLLFVDDLSNFCLLADRRPSANNLTKPTFSTSYDLMNRLLPTGKSNQTFEGVLFFESEGKSMLTKVSVA